MLHKVLELLDNWFQEGRVFCILFCTQKSMSRGRRIEQTLKKRMEQISIGKAVVKPVSHPDTINATNNYQLIFAQLKLITTFALP